MREFHSKSAKRTTLGVTGTYTCAFHNKMFNSIHDVGVVKYQVCEKHRIWDYQTIICLDNITFLTHKS